MGTERRQKERMTVMKAERSVKNIKEQINPKKMLTQLKRKDGFMTKKNKSEMMNEIQEDYNDL